ncbi:MAG: flagellar biosynthetic protein FliO [candidate division Zixibacteria bacterium]|nr:flagellar biosynthetic protein FliO [candidate division Zixibacteria bacterium]
MKANPKTRAVTLAIILAVVILGLLMLTRFGHVTADPSDTTKSYLVQTDSTGTAAGTINPVDKRADNETVFLSMAKLVGALIVVVGAIYAFLFMLRKMMGSKLSANRGHRVLEVLETTYVAQKKSVSLVRFSDRAVLIGITESGITPLAELDGDETARVLSAANAEKSSAGFRNVLSEAKERFKVFSFGRSQNS